MATSPIWWNICNRQICRVLRRKNIYSTNGWTRFVNQTFSTPSMVQARSFVNLFKRSGTVTLDFSWLCVFFTSYLYHRGCWKSLIDETRPPICAVYIFPSQYSAYGEILLNSGPTVDGFRLDLEGQFVHACYWWAPGNGKTSGELVSLKVGYFWTGLVAWRHREYWSKAGSKSELTLVLSWTSTGHGR